MNNNNRITYRFDHTGQASDRETKLIERQPEAALTEVKAKAKASDNEKETAKPAAPQKSNVVPLYHTASGSHSLSGASPWNSPFQDDVSALEQLIRETGQRKSAAKAGAHQPEKAMAADYGGEKDGTLLDWNLEDNSKWKAQDRGSYERTASGSYSQQQDAAAVASVPAPVPSRHHRPVAAAEAEGHFEGYDRQGPLLDEEMMRSEYDGRDGERPFYIRYESPAASPSWLKVFVTVAGALATGALFGYLLLSFFTGSWSDSGHDTPVKQGEVTSPAGDAGKDTAGDGAAPVAGGANGTDEAAGGAAGELPMAAVNIPDTAYYLLQYGVFGSTDGRDAALAELAAKGVASAAWSSGQDYRVYAGMSPSSDDAALLKGQFNGSMDLYAKKFDLSAPSQIPFEGKAEQAQQFFVQTGTLIPMMLGMVNAQLEQPAPSPFSPADSAAWQNAFQQWSDSAAAAKAGFADKEGSASYAELTQALQAAADSFSNYEKNTSRAHLWKAQSALMKAVIAQKNWFEAIIAL
ncbi:hypothetical protein [Paenibacillus protaetiae]|uniref:SPOR domain-containing protein n=1 Tax=Paenibacillus protaetiae TaxID=2509456 RepID=A0A4P6F435_9BACL|nr:hypothetical protein [Paenibacillus protaetiae]QAY65158.1 hypothetical protein ET464_00905 [Paenibacillus protaetiae]